jgi:serine/threonine protein kinase
MRVIGPFEIHEAIARGGNAVVHAARWTGVARDSVPMVAKVAAEGAELALHHENVALRAVQHPNVIAPIALADEADLVALVLPRAACSLRAHSGRLDDAQALGVAAALAEGLHALHRRGIAHGDVTPGNVLLLDDGTPVLSDLGTASTATTERISADVASLARTVRASMQARETELDRVLATFEHTGGDAPALIAALSTLDVAPRAVDVHAAPPVAIEPPTMIVED